MIKLKKLVKEETSLIKEGTRWNVGIEAQSKNRGRAEKSRLKKEGKEFTDSQLASRIAYHANLHKGTGVGYANAFGQLAVFLRDIGYKKSFIEAVKVMKVLAKKKRVESVVEDHIKFTKEEMVQLHKDGKIEKGGHTIEFGESVNEATVSGTDKAVKFWQDMFRPGPIPKEYINQLIKKKGVLPSKSHIKAIYRANKNPSSKDLEKAWKGLVKDKYVRAASGLWRWNKQFESVNEAKIAHSKGGYIEVGKWYLFNYGKWKTQVKVVSIDSKGMKIYNPNDQWKYIIPMNMIKKKKIGGYMTPLKESVNEKVIKVSKKDNIPGNPMKMKGEEKIKKLVYSGSVNNKGSYEIKGNKLNVNNIRPRDKGFFVRHFTMKTGFRKANLYYDGVHWQGDKKF